ncbi:hypothetical protein MLD38_037041 [Melastoma candidum]|uniref:Uncharacterized protein n=1 Tax=Melastoma candidum TaxID=119954 RepID=A0ACB9LLZ6_9MYRT|nr:hypothetical protein MLD38_037041 [Melastoma candidum]
MGFKVWFVFLVLAVAAFVHSSADNLGSFVDPMGDSIGDWVTEEEMALDSEINHRILAAARRYISYGALKRNSVPCSRRGQSYYNCNRMKKANPYKRGCSVITHCKRFTS